MKFLLILLFLVILLLFIPFTSAQDNPSIIKHINWFPDGEQVMLFYENGTLEIWDVESKKITFNEQFQDAHDAILSPDGTRIALRNWGSPGYIKILDLASEQIIILLDSLELAYDIVWSPDGSQLAAVLSSGSGGAAWHWTNIWDVETETYTTYNVGLNGIAWSPDGQYLALTGNYHGNPTHIFDLNVGQKIYNLGDYNRSATSIIWSPDGSKIATGDSNGDVWIWDAPTGELIWQFETLPTQNYDPSVQDLAWSPDSRLVAAASVGRGLDVWDTETGRALQTEIAPDGYITSVVFSPDGSQLAYADYELGLAFIPTPSITDETPVRELTAFSWNPDNKTIAIAYFHGLEIWDTDLDRYTAIETAEPVYDVAWSPDGKQLAVNTGYTNSVIQILDTDGIEQRVFRSQHEGHRLSFPVWSPDGEFVAASVYQFIYRDAFDTHWVETWDVVTGNNEKQVDWGGDGILWSPDGNYVAGAHTQNLGVTELATGASFSNFSNGALDWAWSPDGSILGYSTFTGGIRFWGVAELGGVPFHIDLNEAYAISWHPDGCLLAALTDTTLTLWDIVSGTLVHTQAIDGSAHQLDWSPDGTKLAYSNSQTMEIIPFETLDIAVPECVYDWR